MEVWMTDLMPEFSDPYHEWAVVAKELVRKNEEATMWDLFKVMYEYKTGCEMIEFPDEEEVIYYHMCGMSKRKIAEEVNSSIETVDYILRQNGFIPLRKSLDLSMFEVGEFFETGCGEPPTDLSRHMKEKCIGEYATWRQYERRTNT